MDTSSIIEWSLIAAGAVLLLLSVILTIRGNRWTRRMREQEQKAMHGRLDELQTGTEEAMRLAREAFSTSVTALHTSTLTAQETRQALETVSTQVKEDSGELRKALMRAMEDNRAINRAVVIAVQGIADTAREELTVTRSAASGMADAVKALQSVSHDLSGAASALRTTATGASTPTTRDLAGNARSAQVIPITVAQQAHRQGQVPAPRMSDDIVEVIQLYASSFAELVSDYENTRPLSAQEIRELAATYRTTWVSTMQSLHDRTVGREVWQRFYMYAIAVQTINEFAPRLEGPRLELALRFWGQQVRNATRHTDVYRKIAAEVYRQVQAARSQEEVAAAHNTTSDLLANAS